MYGETFLDDIPIQGGSNEMTSLTENTEGTENYFWAKIVWFVPNISTQTKNIFPQSSL